jgi:hypothetical protein
MEHVVNHNDPFRNLVQSQRQSGRGVLITFENEKTVLKW